MRPAGFLIGILFCVVQISTFAATVGCEQQKCMAVIDAGSTGSRIHMFSYDLDKQNSPINITERWSKKIKPGLATIEADKASIDSYLTNLFQDAPHIVQPVYLFATAGMRLLPKPKQQKTHALIQNWFENQSDWELQSSRTITGSEEGLFGWLSVNYQLGTLTSGQGFVGVMDMGGASVQVVFPVTNATAVNHSDIQQVTLYGRHFNLFSHSFLGMGQNEVTHQFLDSKSCFINDYEMPTGEPAQGDAYACEQEISPLTNTVHQVNSVVQPTLTENPVKNWYVIGGLADLVKSQPFDFKEKEFTNQQLLEQANSKICQQQWSVLSSQYPNNDYLYGSCLFSAYYYSLIIDGYGIQPQQKIYYLAPEQTNDWAMGVILYQQTA